jgi:hypothetical protein
MLPQAMLRINLEPSAGVKERWSGYTGVAVLLRGDYGDP